MIILKLVDWYIEKKKIVNYFTEAEKEYILAHGKVYDNPKFENGEQIHTSSVRSVERNGNIVDIHTKNSIYQCDLKECRYDYQRQIDILPFSVDESKKKYYIAPLIAADRIIMFVDLKANYHLNYVAVYSKDKEKTHLPWTVHLGMVTDTVLIGKVIDHKIHIDIRYYDRNSSIEFYSFDTNNLPVYIQNNGKHKFTYTTEDGDIMELDSGKMIKV